MDTSIFMNLQVTPQTADLVVPLGETYLVWKEIRDFVLEKYRFLIINFIDCN